MQDPSEERLNPSLTPLQSDDHDLSNDLPGTEESPELLRWRADILLDEMMLGAVDIAAGQPNRQLPAEQPFPTSAAGTSLTSDEPGVPGSRDRTHREAPPPQSAATHEEAAPPPSLKSPSWLSSTWHDVTESGSDEAMEGHGVTGRRALMTDSRRQSPGRGALIPDARSGDEEYLRPPSASIVTSAGGSTDIAQSNVDDDGRGRKRRAPWRDDEPTSVFDGYSARSNLLPRESQFDVSSHMREIEQLEGELQSTLPAEHEWRTRSQHLLVKAAAILKSNPDRSAEVDYYLQQVQAILRRARQTHQWSQVYVKRLRIYLLAWAAFSGLGLLSCFLFPEALTRALGESLNITSLYFTRFATGILLTLLAGTFGASLGALLNMARYRRLGRGYIDRKYSLRTLLLPLLALLFALLLSLVMAGIYMMADINPAQAPLYALLPAGIAFVFGLFQESLYGTAP